MRPLRKAETPRRGVAVSHRLQMERTMENCEMKVTGDKLVITVDLKAPGAPSSTGKTLLIASTRGATAIDHPRGIKVALNVMAQR
jgi:hypothetical protein